MEPFVSLPRRDIPKSRDPAEILYLGTAYVGVLNNNLLYQIMAQHMQDSWSERTSYAASMLVTNCRHFGTKSQMIYPPGPQLG